MLNHTTDRATRQTTESNAGSRNSSAPLPRRIDCGAARDDGTANPRSERADARHAWLTSRGMYADQAQAI